MNGAVASSSALLSRLVAPRLGQLDERKYSPVARFEYAQEAIVIVATGVILLLLGGGFPAKFFAVEAAATGCVLLMAATLATRALNWAQWRSVLGDSLALSGALLDPIRLLKPVNRRHRIYNTGDTT